MSEPADPLAALRGPGWQRLLRAARRALERTGGELVGAVGLPAPTDDERRVVIAVTGRHRPPGVGRVSVSVADLDGWLRRGYQRSLADVLDALGGPVRDRPAERYAEQRAVDRMREVVRAGRHGGTEWCRQWLARLDATGRLTRLVRGDGAVTLAAAVAVLDALPADREGGPVPLPVLAERVCGDPKALSATGLAGLVLGAISTWHGLPPPAGAGEIRARWETVGVIVDDLASQVLVLNLPAGGGGPVAGWLTGAAAAGLPFRVTLHQLVSCPVTVTVPVLYVCENPAVLRAAAGRWGAAAAPLVCTEGVPSLACRTVVVAAAAGGAEIRWRNDFDWPGVRIIATAIREYSAVPWRMSAADYRSALSRTGSASLLAGRATQTPWEPALAAAMSAAGSAVMEERLLDELLTDLGP